METGSNCLQSVFSLQTAVYKGFHFLSLQSLCETSIGNNICFLSFISYLTLLGLFSPSSLLFATPTRTHLLSLSLSLSLSSHSSLFPSPSLSPSISLVQISSLLNIYFYKFCWVFFLPPFSPSLPPPPPPPPPPRRRNKNTAASCR